jgi:hypothetical protein
MTKVKEVIEIPEAVCAGDLWLAEELVKKYPIVNKHEWELSKVKGYNCDETPLHFISVIENPLYDPWGRKLIPWIWELSNVELEWEKLHGGVKLHRLQAYFRYTTVAGKPACLYRYELTN